MGKIISSSEHFKLEYDYNQHILIATFKFDSLKAGIEELKKSLYKIAEATGTEDVKGIVMDSSQADFPLSDEMSNWIAENITPVFVKNGVKKVAYVFPQEFITRLGLEMFVDEVSEKVKELKRGLFDNLPEAKEWVSK